MVHDTKTHRPPPDQKPLPSKWQDILVTGNHPYPTRSEAAMALACAMANRGWRWQTFHAALTDETNALSRYYTHRSRRSGSSRRARHDVQARLRRDWAKATLYVAGSPAVHDRQEARQQVGLIREALSCQVWTGRTAVTDRLAIEHIHREATRRGLLVLAVGSRTLAEAIGCSQMTAVRVLHRLQERGWIRLENAGRREEANLYRLTTPTTRATHQPAEDECTTDSQPRRGTPREVRESLVHSSRVTEVHRPEHGPGGRERAAGEDAFLVLGRYAAAAYAVLGWEALTAREVAEVTGMALRTAYKHLGALVEVGLAQRTPDGYRATHRRLGAVALDLGAIGKAEWRRRVHGAQRANWLERLGGQVKVDGVVVQVETGEVVDLASRRRNR